MIQAALRARASSPFTQMNKRKQIKPTTMTNRLKLVTNSLEQISIVLAPFVRRDLKSILAVWKVYSEGFDYYIAHNGKHETVRKYKDLFNVAIRISVNSSFEPLSFTKSDAAGIPFLLKPLLPLLRGDRWDKRFGLTIARIYALIRLKPEIDIDPITKPSSVVIPETLISQFSDFINKTLKERELPQAKIDFGFGVRSGPNGQSVLTAHYDAHALTKYGLHDVWNDMAKRLGSPLRGSFSSCTSTNLDLDKEGLKIGKVSFLSEKGGKTRPIAIVDFWTQQVLKPLHQDIMKVIVKTMGQTDSTFDQNSAFKRAKNMCQGKKVYSFDLKAATDRFPFVLQKLVFQKLYGNEVTDLWEKLLLRPFYVRELNSEIKWAVGQPLGSYSSWPIFTLTHHILVRFAANDPFYTDYQLLGDDILIWNEDVAKRYQEICTQIGVEINLSKSLVSLDINLPYGEFAKRLFLGEDEISPLSPQVMEQAGSLYAFPNLIHHLCDKWELPLDLSEHLALEQFNSKGRRLLSILFGARALGRLSLASPWCALGYESMHSLLEEIMNIVLINQMNSLFSRKSSKIKYVRAKGENSYDAKTLKAEFTKLGLVVSESLLELSYDGDDPHPLLLVLTHINNVELKGLGLKDFINPLYTIDQDEIPKEVEQLALFKSSKIPSTPPLDIFFYEPTDRVTPQTILRIFYTLIDKKTKKDDDWSE